MSSYIFKASSSLMKKANELAVCCDVDVAFVSFSPSGRISKFTNQKKIEDVLRRFVSLPANMRLDHLSNVEVKMEKLKQLDHIKGDNSKLQFLHKQIENLELQIKKCNLELQILNTDLRDYEINLTQEPSLHQFSWCERNLNDSLNKIMARKEFLQMEQIELQMLSQVPYSSTYNRNDQFSATTNPGQVLFQHDHLMNPYDGAGVSGSKFHNLIDQERHASNGNPPGLFDQGRHASNGSLGPLNAPNFPLSSNISNFPIQQSPPIQLGPEIATTDIQIPTLFNSSEQPLMAEQPLLNLFHDQINVNAWNNTSYVVFSDATHMSIQGLDNMQDPRFASIATMVTPNLGGVEMQQPLYDEMRADIQFMNSNMGQFNNMEGQEAGIQFNKLDHDNMFMNDNPRNEYNVELLQDYSKIKYNGHSHDAYIVQPLQGVYEDAGNLLPKDANGDDATWTSVMPRISSGVWEWEELLIGENPNFRNSSQV